MSVLFVYSAYFMVRGRSLPSRLWKPSEFLMQILEPNSASAGAPSNPTPSDAADMWTSPGRGPTSRSHQWAEAFRAGKDAQNSALQLQHGWTKPTTTALQTYPDRREAKRGGEDQDGRSDRAEEGE